MRKGKKGEEKLSCVQELLTESNKRNDDFQIQADSMNVWAFIDI